MPETLLSIPTEAVREELGGSGLDVFLAALGDTTKQNKAIDKRIKEAQTKLERALGIYIFQTTIKSRPLDEGLVRGIDYHKLDDPYPFVKDEWRTFGRIKTFRKPIQSVERIAVRYGQGGNVLQAVAYPRDWIAFEGRLGVINVIPIIGSATYGAGSMILLPITGGAMRRDMIPTILTVDYTAGFLPRDFDRDADEPSEACPDYEVDDLLEAVRLLATSEVLRAVERAIGAGGGSISMYGLSESYNPARFKAERETLEADVETFKQNFYYSASLPPITTIGDGHSNESSNRSRTGGFFS